VAFLKRARTYQDENGQYDQYTLGLLHGPTSIANWAAINSPPLP
jgi:hypothetical protein